MNDTLEFKEYFGSPIYTAEVPEFLLPLDEGTNIFIKTAKEKNPNWKGGVTPIHQKIRCSKEYKLWRDAVFQRDEYTCIWCFSKNGNGKTVILNADHINLLLFILN